uniref:Voltage-dependent calcium channel alpha-2/delta subunit conserved region domain-containing protein n=1 Tax=Oryzias sinensis TaxID=183150 RepID=A0A8C8DNC9_9TELE
ICRASHHNPDISKQETELTVQGLEVSQRGCPRCNMCLFSAHKQRKVDALQPCDTAYPGFMYDSSIRETNSLIKCGRCQKMFVVQQIPDSNLVLVVTQASCDCSRQYGPIVLDPKEIKYILDLMKSQKVRRRPESCHAYHPKVSRFCSIIQNKSQCRKCFFIFKMKLHFLTQN